MVTSTSDAPQKNILLMSCGLYPQIITEVIYALSQQNPPVYLDEVEIITTEVGRERIERYLLDEKSGAFFKLCEEYGLPRPRFELDQIELLENTKGVPLDDVESLEDNEVVANRVTEIVRTLTARDESTLHVSLTGGRKTLSYYLGYALSLFGRPQDRLSHTLVCTPYLADDEFFYPNKSPTYITHRDGRTLNTQDAKVQLVEIPFVRLRQGLPERLLVGEASFVEVVSCAQKASEKPRLRIDMDAKEVYLGDVLLSLTPSLFCWYAWHAVRLKSLGQDLAPISARNADKEEFLALIEKLYGKYHSLVERTRNGLQAGMENLYISEKNSRVNRLIERQAMDRAHHFRIHPLGKRPNTQYGLTLSLEDIQILNA